MHVNTGVRVRKEKKPLGILPFSVHVFPRPQHNLQPLLPAAPRDWSVSHQPAQWSPSDHRSPVEKENWIHWQNTTHNYYREN